MWPVAGQIDFMELYLSDLIGNPVLNQSKEKIGKIADLVVGDINKPHPKINGLVVGRGVKKDRVFIPEADIDSMSPKQVRLATDVVDLSPFSQKSEELLLAQEVFDKQIVDIDDRRLTRVNDLLLELEHKVLRLKGVDVSALGILKRLRLPTIGNILKHNIVDWEDVQFLGGNAPMKFKVQYKNLESLHPVDIARIIFEGPGYKQGSRVLASLKDPIAADILEALSPKLQWNLIQSMKLEDVVDVVEHMPSHKAGDLLVTLGADYAKKILPRLSLEHAKEIKEILNYPENSTGAFTNTDYIALPESVTLEEAFKRIKELKTLPDFLTYWFILENDLSNKLTGVVSDYEFLKAENRSRLQTIMVRNLITTHPLDPIRESLKKMYRYNLSALPVVTQGDKLLGIVTFRDAISIYMPKRWKVRIRRIIDTS